MGLFVIYRSVTGTQNSLSWPMPVKMGPDTWLSLTDSHRSSCRHTEILLKGWQNHLPSVSSVSLGGLCPAVWDCPSWWPEDCLGRTSVAPFCLAGGS